MATELDFLFEKGNFDERRLLSETLFKRVYLEDGKISKIELNAPFGLIATRSKGSGTVANGGAEVTIGRTFKLAFSLSMVMSQTSCKSSYGVRYLQKK